MLSRNSDRLWLRLKDKHLEELARGALGFLNLRVLGIGLSYVFTILATRQYGMKAYGIYTLAVAALRIALLYGRFGLDNALVRFSAEYEAAGRRDFVKKVYSRSLAAVVPTSAFIALLLYFGAPFLTHTVFKKPDLIIALPIIAAIVVPGALMHLNASFLRGLKFIKSYSFLTNVAQFLLGSLTLLVGGAFLERSTAPVMAYAIGTGAAALLSFLFLLQTGRKPVLSNGDLNGRGNGPAEAIGSRALVKVAFPMLLTGSYTFFLQWTGTLVLGAMRPEAEVGIYGVAVKAAALLTFTLTSVNSIAASKFSECHANGDMAGLQKVTAYSTRMIFWTTAPLGVVFLAIPGPIMKLFDETAASGAACLLILVAGSLMNAAAGPVGTILNMTGHQVAYQRMVLSAAVVNIALNFALVPGLGINGSAIASTVCMFVWNVAAIIYIKKKFGFLTLYVPFFKRRGVS